MAVAAVSENTPIYHPRVPSASPLWRLLDDHYELFRSSYPDSFVKRYGYPRAVVDRVVRGYLDCGDLAQGFARIRCTTPGCRHEMLLAFSCKGRWFCPSCHQKKSLLFAEQVVGEVLYPVPHRQFVFTIPRMLRPYFRHNRKLLSGLCRCAKESLETYLKTLLRVPDGVIGMVAVILTFGDYARFHPHLHAIVADGLFRPSGAFHVAPPKDTKPLMELFRAKVLKLLKNEGKIDQHRIRAILGWRHSGFSTYRGDPVRRDDQRGQERLAQYVTRNAFSVAKMTYAPTTGSVIYRSETTHGKNKRNFEVFDGREFIAAVVQHIPPPRLQMVRYYGWYSNRARGDRKRRGLQKPGSLGEEVAVEILDVTEHQPTKVASKTWRELIWKVWEVDPLRCPKCDGEMKVIALIEDEAVVRKILQHLDLWQIRRGDERGTAPEEDSQAEPNWVYDPVDDGWPGWSDEIPADQPAMTLH
ncbi:MAG: transposase [Deferrisomatales bacterium]|nr:transposase [Deferrisomatales bacterium]